MKIKNTIISIDAQKKKTFDKVQNSFMIKCSTK